MYGEGWTAGRVLRRLVTAFAAMRGHPIYSPRQNAIVPLTGPVDGADLIVATAEYLGRESALRLQLLTFARCKASRASISAVCRERGWPRMTFYRHIGKAAASVALQLNERHCGLAVSLVPDAEHSAGLNVVQLTGDTARRTSEGSWQSQSRAQKPSP